MTVSSTASSATPPALGPHDLAQRVPCTICRAETGAPCLDDDATVRDYPHHSRWIRYQQLMRRRPFTAIVRRKVDDRVEIGDVLLCVATPEGGTLRVLADGLGTRERPEVIDARAVEFRAFVDETGHRGRRRPMRGRHVIGA